MNTESRWSGAALLARVKNGIEGLTTSGSKREVPILEEAPLSEEIPISDRILAEEPRIRELGFEFIDTLRDTFGEEHLEQDVRTSQGDFYQAVGKFLGIKAEEIELAHVEDSKLFRRDRRLSCLDLTLYSFHYTLAGRTSKETSDEALIGKGRDRETRSITFSALYAAHEASLRDKGYEGEEFAEAMQVKHKELRKAHFGVEAALQGLRETLPEAAEALARIKDLPFATFIEQANDLLDSPSVAMHVEQKDYHNPIFLGIRETIYSILLEREERWKEYGTQTIFEPFKPSLIISDLKVTRHTHAQQLEARMRDTGWLQKEARSQHESAIKQANTFQTYDFFLSELERYAQNGREPLPNTNQAQQADEWSIGQETPDNLMNVIRLLVQSIPQREIRNLLLLKQERLRETIQKRMDDKSPIDPLQQRFYIFFYLLLDTTQEHWKAYASGRDKLHFLHRDIQEKALEETAVARKPISTLSKGILAGLQEDYLDDISFLQTMDDIRDIVQQPDCFMRLHALGSRLGVKTEAMERKVLCHLVKTKEAYTLVTAAHGAPKARYRPRYNNWHQDHPIARWQQAA